MPGHYLRLLLFSALASISLAVPTAPTGSDLAWNENVLLFDAAAYETSTCPVQHLSTVQAYTYTAGSLSAVVELFGGFLGSVGSVVDDEELKILQSRAKYFATTPIGGKTVRVKADGCGHSFPVGKTVVLSNNTNDAGMAISSGRLGSCDDKKTATGKAVLNRDDERSFTNTVYKSGKTGWGVISDIDDTIKITGSGIDAVKATLIEEATPVPGMPALYATLTELIDPAWIYLTGSPWQLYGMLHDFIGDNFSQSAGPILMKNLTYTGVEGLLEFLAEGTSTEYKAGRIDDIHNWYPGKTYLGIGDSGGHDPESYAYAYHHYGPTWMKCIWIHLIEGGNNTDARFAEAFKGIPDSAYKLYSDPSELNPQALLEGACF